MKRLPSILKPAMPGGTAMTTAPKITPIGKPSIVYQAPVGAFGHGPMTPRRVTLHDTESHDAIGIADIEGVANYWMQTPEPDRLGAHFIVDAAGNAGQCAHVYTETWHTLDDNADNVGIEQIGFAAFSEDAWMDRLPQLRKVAKFLAWLNNEYHVPLRLCQHAGDSGIQTHAMSTAFLHIPGGHTDPGSGYPLSYVVWLANHFRVQGGWQD